MSGDCGHCRSTKGTQELKDRYNAACTSLPSSGEASDEGTAQYYEALELLASSLPFYKPMSNELTRPLVAHQPYKRRTSILRHEVLPWEVTEQEWSASEEGWGTWNGIEAQPEDATGGERSVSEASWESWDGMEEHEASSALSASGTDGPTSADDAAGLAGDKQSSSDEEPSRLAGCELTAEDSSMRGECGHSIRKVKTC